MLRRNYSENSLLALYKLQQYEKDLLEIETKIIYIETHITLSNYKDLLDKLAQLNGDLDKIQFEGIDSIITVELNTGKYRIKKIRKHLNSKCEIIRQKILDIHTLLHRYV